MSNRRALAFLVFAQMLPATLVVPAIRPLFAGWHGGAEGPMHAFMSLNMLGAALAAPLLARWLDRRASRAPLLAALAFADAALLALVATALPTPLVLGLRLLEGAAHVGAATLLMAEASAAARRENDSKIMALAGAAVMTAVASGSVLGTLLLSLDPRAPFAAAALCAATVGVYGPRRVVSVDVTPRAPGLLRALLVPASAAFVGRFTVGCLVVSFALFARESHGLGDRAVGALFALLTVPFAAATYPALRLQNRPALLGGGAFVLALAVRALADAPAAALGPIMITAGLASAAIYAATLGYAAAVPDGRARAMGLLHAAGCLGMLAGPAAAGLVSATLGRAAVFSLASGAILLWLAASAPALLSERRRSSTPADPARP